MKSVKVDFTGGRVGSPDSPLKKLKRNSSRVKVVAEVAIFLKELALAKPVAHDEMSCEQFFNGLLRIRRSKKPGLVTDA